MEADNIPLKRELGRGSQSAPILHDAIDRVSKSNFEESCILKTAWYLM